MRLGEIETGGWFDAALGSSFGNRYFKHENLC
jgi:hypothetical protein